MAQDHLIETIRRALEKPGKSQRGLAEALGRTESVVSKILSGHRLVKAGELPKIRAYLDLVAVDGDRMPEDFIPIFKQEFTGVPLLDLRASAGAGSVVSGQEIVTKEKMMFDVSWLRRISPRPQDLFVLEISGDSMWETLHDGDHALVDPNQADARREGLYVLRTDDVLQVKRLSMHPVTRTMTVKSDNPAYPTYSDIDPADLSLVGRVVWIGRRL